MPGGTSREDNFLNEVSIRLQLINKALHILVVFGYERHHDRDRLRQLHASSKEPCIEGVDSGQGSNRMAS